MLPRLWPHNSPEVALRSVCCCSSLYFVRPRCRRLPATLRPSWHPTSLGCAACICTKPLRSVALIWLLTPDPFHFAGLARVLCSLRRFFSLARRQRRFHVPRNALVPTKLAPDTHLLCIQKELALNRNSSCIRLRMSRGCQGVALGAGPSQSGSPGGPHRRNMLAPDFKPSGGGGLRPGVDEHWASRSCSCGVPAQNGRFSVCMVHMDG